MFPAAPVMAQRPGSAEILEVVMPVLIVGVKYFERLAARPVTSRGVVQISDSERHVVDVVSHRAMISENCLGCGLLHSVGCVELICCRQRVERQQ